MAIESKIAWTDASQNFWYCCHKISPGCAYCYAERWAKMSGRDFDKVTRSSPKTFNAPLKWKEPKVIFTCSLSDFFIEEADAWRDEAWEIIKNTPQHTWLILSKRWDRVANDRKKFIPWWRDGDPPWPHVRFGCSAEIQSWLEHRWNSMTFIKAAGYFISAEPLLGPLDLSRIATLNLSTVIVGGESGGPEHRCLVNQITSSRVHDRGAKLYLPKLQALEWVENIRDQCERRGINFFFKQWGGAKPDSGGHALNGKIYQEAIR